VRERYRVCPWYRAEKIFTLYRRLCTFRDLIGKSRKVQSTERDTEGRSVPELCIFCDFSDFFDSVLCTFRNWP